MSERAFLPPLSQPLPILVTLQGPNEVSLPLTVSVMCVGCQPPSSTLRTDHLHHPDESSVSSGTVFAVCRQFVRLIPAPSTRIYAPKSCIFPSA